MLRWWSFDLRMEGEPAPRVSWPVALALGALLVALGLLILVEPLVLTSLVAGLLLAGGIFGMALAAAEGWRQWRNRPRRIPIRVIR